MKYILLLVFGLFPSLLYAQKALPSFVKKELNTISDKNRTLYPFLDKLYRLECDKKKPVPRRLPHVVQIMHIGDSHIQAGFWSVTIMNRLQQTFGSAGRGLIFPLKLARTNEPYDYLIKSESRWDKSLCVQRSHKIPLGIGGLSIQAEDEHFTFDIISYARQANDHSFNKVTVFHHEKAPDLKVVNADVSFQRGSDQYPFTTVYRLNKRVNRISFASIPDEKADSAIYYGFNLENGRDGILYHAIGLNGAQFRHYASVHSFASQMAVLTPQLFIFSLGTNEAFRGRIIEKTFFAEIDRIINPIRAANPHAQIIITIPPDCLEGGVKKSRKSNANIASIRKYLLHYADIRQYAYWDLYALLGGDNSANRLYTAGYLASDGVHLKKDGYTMIGNLFYDALINYYKQYVQLRTR